VQWSLQNDQGDRVASGIYLFVVESADRVHSRGKFVIIR